MTCNFEKRNKLLMIKSKNRLFKSITHKTLGDSIIRRYSIPYPIFGQIDEIMTKFIIIYDKKHEPYEVYCVLKLLTTTNCLVIINYGKMILIKSVLQKIEFKMLTLTN